MTDLHQDGYIILPKAITEKELDSGLQCMKGNKVDYSIMKSFVDNIFLKKVSESTDLTQPIYLKFRFSNNNNSTDASTFHGDIYNHTNSKLLPIYTCLCYFDNAQLEVVPKSHLYNRSEWSVSSYNNRKIINMNRGDVLVFHSNLHHRGINFNKSKNRRLLQVFEVFPDQKTFDKEAPKCIIVLSSQSPIMKAINPLSYYIAKTPFIALVTFCHYILMYNDLHYKIGLMDIEPWKKKDRYITYEPVRQICIEELVNNNSLEDLNINILCNKNVEQVPHSNYYLYFYILYWIVSLILLYILVKLWYNQKLNMKNIRSSSKRIKRRSYGFSMSGRSG
jgi:hypothetical protein